MTIVESLLLKDGPCLSSPDVARQRIARAGPNVLRLKGLIFPRNARFLYHEKDASKERYWTALARVVREASPAYGPALAALRAPDGVVPLEQFSIVSGSPIRQRGQISSETVLERLEAVHLVRRCELQGVGRSWRYMPVAISASRTSDACALACRSRRYCCWRCATGRGV